jgi:hypothetical protein
VEEPLTIHSTAPIWVTLLPPVSSHTSKHIYDTYLLMCEKAKCQQQQQQLVLMLIVYKGPCQHHSCRQGYSGSTGAGGLQAQLCTSTPHRALDPKGDPC